MFATVGDRPVGFAIALEVGRRVGPHALAHHLADDHPRQLFHVLSEALDLELEEGKLAKDVRGFEMAKLLNHSSFLLLLSHVEF